jgi:hypothetical protein
MIDIDPKLESQLRAKFQRLEAAVPPPSLTTFRPTAVRRPHRSLNVIAGVVAIAVIAGAAAVFAVELASHPHQAPAVASAQGRALPKLPVYSPAPPPPHVYLHVPMPQYGTGFPRSWHIVIPVTRHTGSAVLPTFIPAGYVYIQYACVGPGHLEIVTADGTVNENLKPCSNTPVPVDAEISGAYGPLSGAPVAVKVVVNAYVHWEMVVAETATPLQLPTLPPLPANATVLVPLTSGLGVASLPSFPTQHFINIQYWCSGPGGITVYISNGNQSMGASNCGTDGFGGSVDYTGKRTTLVVDVNIAARWEIRVYTVPNEPNNPSG